MRVFISGGCKNGKSSHAQRIAVDMRKPDVRLYYAATMIPADGEDEDRIQRHRLERADMGFETLEIPRDITSLLKTADSGGVFLLDSVTALLANEMFPSGGKPVSGVRHKICGEMDILLREIPNIVLVSDYIYSDACIYDDTTEAYRRSLAYIDRFLAKRCELVLEASYGNITVHKGGRYAAD